MAEGIKAAFADLRKFPQNSKKHKELAKKIADYFVHTGVPVSVSLSPDGVSFDVRIIPMTQEKWREFGQKWSTSHELQNQVNGSDFPPELVSIALAVSEKGFDTVFNTASLLDFHAGADAHNSRFVLFPPGIFSKQPLERHLLTGDLSELLPAGKSRVVAAIELPSGVSEEPEYAETADPLSAQPVWKYASDLAIAKQLRDEINELKAARSYMDPSLVRAMTEQKLGMLEYFLVSAEKTHRTVDKILGSGLKPKKVSVVGRKDGYTIVAFPGERDAGSVFLVLEMDKSLPEAQVPKEAHRLIENERENVITGRTDLKALGDFVKHNREGLKVKNELSLDQLADFQRRDRESLEAKLQAFGVSRAYNKDLTPSFTYAGGPAPKIAPTITPAEYFNKLFEDTHYWSPIAEKIVTRFLNEAAAKLANDPKAL